jgi:hypothetical protein
MLYNELCEKIDCPMIIPKMENIEHIRFEDKILRCIDTCDTGNTNKCCYYCRKYKKCAPNAGIDEVFKDVIRRRKLRRLINERFKADKSKPDCIETQQETTLAKRKKNARNLQKDKMPV